MFRLAKWSLSEKAVHVNVYVNVHVHVGVGVDVTTIFELFAAIARTPTREVIYMRISRLTVLAAIVFLGFSACFTAFPAIEGRFERTLDVSGPVDLDVATGSGRIEVHAGSSTVVRISGTIRARDDWRAGAEEKVRFLESEPPIEQSGSTIRIGRIEDERYRNVSINYQIEVPADTRLTSRTGAGDQKVDGVRGPVEAITGSGSIVMNYVGGDVNARAGSGNIELASISGRLHAGTGSGSITARRIAGAVDASTGSGNITLEQAAAETDAADVEVSAGSGSINISGVNGALRARTGSGNISVSGNPTSEWKIHTASGGARLHLPRDAAFDLYAHTGSGSISVDHPVTLSGTVRRNEMRGTVRGGGSLVEVRTGSGNVRLE
jgi:hypothetical protein